MMSGSNATQELQFQDSRPSRARLQRWRLLELDDAQVARLKRLKWYRSGVSCSEPIMDRFWHAVLKFVPRDLAPNVITLVGCALVTVSSLPLMLCETKTGLFLECSPWIYVFCAVGVFLYQLCDALDGKQARRTGEVSPLGALADWTADSTASVFIPLTCCLSLGVGNFGPAWIVLLTMFYTAGFYAATWESCMFGVYHFGVFDDLEAQFLMMAMYLATAIWGPSVWNAQLPIGYSEFQFGLSLRTVVLFALWTPETYMFFRQVVYLVTHVIGSEQTGHEVKVVIHSKQHDHASSGQVASTRGSETPRPVDQKTGVAQQCLCDKCFRDPTGVFYPAFHLLVAFTLASLLMLVADDLLTDYAVWIGVLAALPIAKAIDMHVVSTTTAQESSFRVIDTMWSGQLLLLINSLVGQPIPPAVALVGCLSLSVFDYVNWHKNLWLDLAMYLEIHALRSNVKKSPLGSASIKTHDCDD